MKQTRQLKNKTAADVLLIESVKDGRLLGRSQGEPGRDAAVFSVEIDGQWVARGQANRFYVASQSLNFDRKDGGMGDYCGFDIPLDAYWYDGLAHGVVLKNESGQVLCQQQCVFPLNINALVLKESLLYERTLHAYQGEKRIAVVAGFIDRGVLSLHQQRLLKDLYQRGYYVIYAVALANEALSHKPMDASGLCHVLLTRRNVGYDFGSWGHVWLAYSRVLKQASEVLFVNDSMVGPLFSSAFNDEFNALNFDLCGVTESYQYTWHIQSYLWRVSSNILATAHLDHFFCGRLPAAANKDDAITHYELALASYFRNQGFSVGVWADTAQIKALTFDAFQRLLQHRLMLNGLTFEVQALADMTSQHLADKSVPYLAMLLSDQNHNPSHLYWKGLVDLGFPYVKKELLTKNPTQYPFIDELDALFESDELKQVLIDLLRNSGPSVAHNI